MVGVAIFADHEAEYPEQSRSAATTRSESRWTSDGRRHAIRRTCATRLSGVRERRGKVRAVVVHADFDNSDALDAALRGSRASFPISTSFGHEPWFDVRFNRNLRAGDSPEGTLG